MVVNTQRLFAQLLARLEIGTVCDIGSMNGADALLFASAAPGCAVYAFEPNPENLAGMGADERLAARNIHIVPAAVSDRDGEADFYLVQADYARRDPRRGMSSLYRRTGEWAPTRQVRVRTMRLDSFLTAQCPADTRVALWIDTEGKAFEVIAGMGALAPRVHLLHVEVETTACIGAAQKLYPDVRALLERCGFVELATDQPRAHVQFNALFVRRARTPRARRLAWLWQARVRYVLVRTVCRLCPGCVRRYQNWRAAR
jgi:FkbM family methyltransferase